MSSFYLANFYSGTDSEKHLVTVAVEDGEFVIANQNNAPALHIRVPVTECVIDTPLTAHELTITLPDSGRLEVFESHELYKTLQNLKLLKRVSAFQLENNTKIFIVIFVALIVNVIVLYKFVLPDFSQLIAMIVPTKWTHSLDEMIVQQLDARVLQPTELTIEQQQTLIHYLQENGLADREIYFRKGGLFQANAFALSGNKIFFTDELIKHIPNRRQLLAIALHENGHIEERHVLTGIISKSLISLGTLFFSDMAGGADIITGSGYFLLSQKFTRDQESAADLAAITSLKKMHIPTNCFVAALRSLESYYDSKKDYKDDIRAMEYLSSHPNTGNRIKQIELSDFEQSSTDACDEVDDLELPK